MTANIIPTYKVLLVFLACNLMLGILAYSGGTYYGEVMSPLYKWVVDKTFRYYQVKDLILEHKAQKKQFHLRVDSRHERYYKGYPVQTGVALSANTLLGHALQHFVIIFSVILTYLYVKKRNFIKVFLASLVALIIVEMVDIPFVLMASIEDLVLYSVSGSTAESGLISWMHFMSGGGRQVISLVAALFTLIINEKVWENRLATR